jgi:N-acetylmuramoyl-L-alanine amidase
MRPILRPSLLALLTVAGVAPARAEGRASTVVIDPGHGGSNAGAPAVGGASEKRVTLAVARLLGRELERRGLAAVLTRTRDEYLTLGERVRRANASDADLFVSLHANASIDHARRGVETYVVAREIQDAQAAHAAEAAGGPAQAMLARARARQAAAESARLARAVQKRLGEARGGDRGVRQAPYDVLDGVQVPAVLVEVGFVDHPEEGRELLDPVVQERIAQAIADGIAEFVARRDGAVARR